MDTLQQIEQVAKSLLDTTLQNYPSVYKYTPPQHRLLPSDTEREVLEAYHTLQRLRRLKRSVETTTQVYRAYTLDAEHQPDGLLRRDIVRKDEDHDEELRILEEQHLQKHVWDKQVPQHERTAHFIQMLKYGQIYDTAYQQQNIHDTVEYKLLRYLLQKRDAISKKLLQVQARNAEMQQQISLTTKRIIDLQKKNKELMGKVRDAEAELKGVTKQQEYERATTLYASRKAQLERAQRRVALLRGATLCLTMHAQIDWVSQPLLCNLIMSLDNE